MRADSFITSPSEPVSVSELPPAIRDASIRSVIPHRGPRQSNRHAGFFRSICERFLQVTRCAGQRLHHFDGDRDEGCIAFGVSPRNLAADGANLTFEISHTCFTGVTANDGNQSLVFERDRFGTQPVVRDLPSHQMVMAIASFSRSV